jgi:hypothetical protein
MGGTTDLASGYSSANDFIYLVSWLRPYISDTPTRFDDPIDLPIGKQNHYRK